MNTRKFIVPLVATLMTLMWFATPTKTHADFVNEQAQNAVSLFNSLNDGRGYYYTVSPADGTWGMTTVQGSGQADLSAYSPLVSGENFAKTFCVEPLIGTGARHYGQLNYDGSSTSTTSGNQLTLGAAYLYANFALGELSGYNYDTPSYNGSMELQGAIQYLIGADFNENWRSNSFLADLLGVNSDTSYWTQVYDPGQYYDELGDYSVFVMNNSDEYGTNTQDFLFLVAHEEESSGGATTPEPASILIFGTGLAGLGLARRFRRKRSERC